MPSAPVCIMENEAGSEYLFKKCSRKPLLQGDLSHHGVKEKYQPLYQKLVLNMVEVTGFEPATFWSRTKRATKLRYTSKMEPMKGLEPLTCGLRNRCSTD